MLRVITVLRRRARLRFKFGDDVSGTSSYRDLTTESVTARSCAWMDGSAATWLPAPPEPWALQVRLPPQHQYCLTPRRRSRPRRSQREQI